MKYTVYNEEVLLTDETVTRITAEDVAELKSLALKNERRRIRLCAHPNMEDALHEMIIVLPKGTYVRPHKHLGKSESFHIIEGCLKVFMFDDTGNIREELTMGTAGSGKTLFYRLSDSTYHTVVPQSPVVVFHEVTNGPFHREDTAYAPWAPDDRDRAGVVRYRQERTDMYG
jgi:cupin fold WbuC family metalloprotein